MASISNVVGTAKLKKNYVPFSDKLTKSLEDVTKTIEENKATLDTIQELGIGLSQAVNALSASALHYANMVNNILDLDPAICAKPALHPETNPKIPGRSEHFRR